MIKTVSLNMSKPYLEIIYGDEEGISNAIVSSLLFSGRGRLMADGENYLDIYSFLFRTAVPEDLDNMITVEITSYIESKFYVEVTEVNISRNDSDKRTNYVEIIYFFDNSEYRIVLKNRLTSSNTNQDKTDLL